MSEIESSSGYIPLLPDRDGSYKTPKPFVWEKDSYLHGYKNPNNEEINNKFKLRLISFESIPNDLDFSSIPELRTPVLPSFEEATKEFEAAQKAFDTISAQYNIDAELAEILARSDDRGFDAGSVNLVVSMSPADQINVDLVLRNAAYTPTEEEVETERRIAEITRNFTEEAVDNLTQATLRLSAARSQLFQAASWRRISEKQNPKATELPNLLSFLSDEFSPLRHSLSQNHESNPLINGLKRMSNELNFEQRNNSYQKDILSEQNQLKQLKKLARNLGLTPENIHELHGQMLLTSGLPFEIVDMIFAKFYEALDYYDGSADFEWPANYREDYQPDLNSQNSHPENS